MSRRVALIGKPLRRRHSWVMHNAAFAHFGIDAEYELRETEPGELPGFATEARGPDWLGFQVTAPYKEAIVAHLDRVEESAQEIGAVNSAVRDPDGALVGFNTDAPGFVTAIHASGMEIAGSKAAVAGAGGAARAVVWGLLTEGAAGVVIGNRTLQRGAALARSMSHLGGVRAVPLDDEGFEQALATCQIAVNATTVGMTKGTTSFDVGLLPPDAAVYDLVYVPAVTPLVEAARARGLRVRNGLDMLVDQAQTAFQRWTGISGSGGVMRAALEDWSPPTNDVA